MRCDWAQRAVWRHGGEVCVGSPTHPCQGKLVCPGDRGTQLTDRVGMLRVVRQRRAILWHGTSAESYFAAGAATGWCGV